MSQDEVNRRQWEDDANWSGPRWMAIYFSKADSRTWVRKRIRWLGWTLNLGQPAGFAWLCAFLAGVPLLVALAFVLASVCQR